MKPYDRILVSSLVLICSFALALPSSGQIINGTFDSPDGWQIESDWPVEFLAGGNPGGRACILSDCCAGDGSLIQVIQLPGIPEQGCTISFEYLWLITAPRRDHEVYMLVYASINGTPLQLTEEDLGNSWIKARASIPCGTSTLRLGLSQFGGPDPEIPGGPGVCFDNVRAAVAVPTETLSWGRIKARF